jgi:hypothetical protein
MWFGGNPILSERFDVSDYVEGGQLQPGQWYQVIVPLGDLVPEGGSFDQINFAYDGSDASTTFYLDQIRLVAGGS